ncbi:type II toxin-antitoxin system YafQ family toxin [Rothia sp. P5766]|uniref:type II toxin-antitoxin system RelE/ParE family toxin n=1 Tax=Rothia sp. P5766 TaxID=3402656 RepID=UPI003AE25929
MLCSITRTPQFKRDAKALFKKHDKAEKLAEAVQELMAENKELLTTKYRDHALKGNWKGYRELHIEGDWLLVCRVDREELVLVLTRTGSHDDLF